MKVKIIASVETNIDPEDFREVNDEGKEGPVPSNKDIISLLRNSGIEYIIDYFLAENTEIKVEEI